MKVTYTQHVPYRHMPSDFRSRHPESVITVPYHENVDPDLLHGDLKAALDEAMHAARAGFDAIGFTEHGQSSYDINPNPDLPAAAFAYASEAEGLETGIYVLGRSLGKSREPLRVAEELAWIDSLSRGRLLSCFPVGLPYDASINAGVPPIEVRARYDENLELILRAWTEKDVFPWNGKYSQHAQVNIWPRPYQNPHPPVSITGIGNPATSRFALERDLGFNSVVLGGASADGAQKLFDQFWSLAEELGKDDNPYRAGYSMFVLVADSDAEAERLYSKHVEYSFGSGLGHIPPNRYMLPGGISPQGLKAVLSNGAPPQGGPPSYRDLVESGAIVAGSPETVLEKLLTVARNYRVGTIHTFLQVGSMPPELTKANIDLFGSKVLPGLKGQWSEYEDDNRWWPTRLGGKPASSEQANSEGARLK